MAGQGVIPGSQTMGTGAPVEPVPQMPSLGQSIASQWRPEEDYQRRLKLVANLHPQMQNDMKLLDQLARSEMDDDQLTQSVDDLVEWNTTAGMAERFNSLDREKQKAAWGRLTPEQQKAWREAGAQIKPMPQPNQPTRSALLGGRAINIPGVDAVSDAVGGALSGGIGAVGGLLGDAIHHAGAPLRQVQHAYRVADLSFRGMSGDRDRQVLAAELGVNDLSELENFSGTMKLWRYTSQGERTFSPKALADASDSLEGDGDRLNIARRMAAGETIDELAADSGAEIGSQAYTDAYKALMDVQADPKFKVAMFHLTYGKISPGRDAAAVFADPGSDAFNFVSGVLDASFSVAADPLMVAGKITKLARMSRWGVVGTDGINTARFFRRADDGALIVDKVAVARKVVHPGEAGYWTELASMPVNQTERYATMVADHAKAGMWHELKQADPQSSKVLLSLSNYDRSLRTEKALAKVDEASKVTTKIGPNKGMSDALDQQFFDLSKKANEAMKNGDEALSESFRELAAEARQKSIGATVGRTVLNDNPALREGMSQPSDFVKWLDDGQGVVDILRGRMGSYRHGFTEMPRLSRSGAVKVRAKLATQGAIDFLADPIKAMDEWDDFAEIGTEGRRAIARVVVPAVANGLLLTPMARVLKTLVELTPREGILQLSGASTAEALDQFLAFGFSGHARADAFNAFVKAPDVGVRLRSLAQSQAEMFRSMGVLETKTGREFAERFINSNTQAYIDDGTDLMEGAMGLEHVGIDPMIDTAFAVGIPDFKKLQEMAGQSRRMSLTHALFGSTPSKMADAFLGSYWKPAILLRLGFIPRVAAEEAITTALRFSPGVLTRGWAGQLAASPNDYALGPIRAAQAVLLHRLGDASPTSTQQAMAHIVEQIARPATIALRATARAGLRMHMGDEAVEAATLVNVAKRGVIQGKLDDTEIMERLQLAGIMVDDPTVAGAMARQMAAGYGRISSREANLLGSSGEDTKKLITLTSGGRLDEGPRKLVLKPVGSEYESYGKGDMLFDHSALWQLTRQTHDPVAQAGLAVRALYVEPATAAEIAAKVKPIVRKRIDTGLLEGTEDFADQLLTYHGQDPDEVLAGMGEFTKEDLEPLIRKATVADPVYTPPSAVVDEAVEGRDTLGTVRTVSRKVTTTDSIALVKEMRQAYTDAPKPVQDVIRQYLRTGKPEHLQMAQEMIVDGSALEAYVRALPDLSPAARHMVAVDVKEARKALVDPGVPQVSSVSGGALPSPTRPGYVRLYRGHVTMPDGAPVEIDKVVNVNRPGKEGSLRAATAGLWYTHDPVYAQSYIDYRRARFQNLNHSTAGSYTSPAEDLESAIANIPLDDSVDAADIASMALGELGLQDMDGALAATTRFIEAQRSGDEEAFAVAIEQLHRRLNLHKSLDIDPDGGSYIVDMVEDTATQIAFDLREIRHFTPEAGAEHVAQVAADYGLPPEMFDEWVGAQRRIGELEDLSIVRRSEGRTLTTGESDELNELRSTQLDVKQRWMDVLDDRASKLPEQYRPASTQVELRGELQYVDVPEQVAEAAAIPNLSPEMQALAPRHDWHHEYVVPREWGEQAAVFNKADEEGKLAAHYRAQEATDVQLIDGLMAGDRKSLDLATKRATRRALMHPDMAGYRSANKRGSFLPETNEVVVAPPQAGHTRIYSPVGRPAIIEALHGANQDELLSVVRNPQLRPAIKSILEHLDDSAGHRIAALHQAQGVNLTEVPLPYGVASPQMARDLSDELHYLADHVAGVSTTGYMGGAPGDYTLDTLNGGPQAMAAWVDLPLSSIDQFSTLVRHGYSPEWVLDDAAAAKAQFVTGQATHEQAIDAWVTKIEHKRTRLNQSHQDGRVMHEIVGPLTAGDFSMEHLGEVNFADLPPKVVGPKYVEHHENIAQKVVRYGFDQVIGPAVDAMVREPLFAHTFMQSYRDARHLEGVFVDPKIVRKLDGVTDLASKRREWAALKPTERNAILDMGGAHNPLGITPKQVRDLDVYHQHMLGVESKIREVAIERAVTDTIPFIDDHRVRSQFQEWGRAFVPFLFAEEQFYKRWARTLKHSPEALEKGLLALHGIRHMGLVQQDQYGNDVFVYPGSVAMNRILGKGAEVMMGGKWTLPLEAPLTGQLKYAAPGFDRLGLPGVSPIIGLPLTYLRNRFPEAHAYSQAEEVLHGERGANRGYIEQVIPSWLARTYKAVTDSADADSQLASSSISAMALMHMADPDGTKGIVPGEGATEGEIEEFVERATNWSRIVQLTRAVIGYAAPASPQAQLKDGQMNAELVGLLRNLPVEDAMAAFMEKYPDATPYTVFGTQSAGGSPLPATDEVLGLLQDHRNFFETYSKAGGWLLPQADADDASNRQAYNESLAIGLRLRKAPTEWYEDYKFAAGADAYFASSDAHKRAQASFTPGDPRKTAEAEQWKAWKDAYLTAHPTFARQLNDPSRIQRREQVVGELRQALNDPLLPPVAHAADLRTMIDSYDAWAGALDQLYGRRDTLAVMERKRINIGFANWLEAYSEEHPQTKAFYQRILKPQIDLPDEDEAVA